MSALQRASLMFRKATGGPCAAGVRTRAFAAHHEPAVTWADYRSGKKTLNEWVDGNRAQVAFGFFVFYCSLAAWNLRPRSKEKKDEAHGQPEASPSS